MDEVYPKGFKASRQPLVSPISTVSSSFPPRRCFGYFVFPTLSCAAFLNMISIIIYILWQYSTATKPIFMHFYIIKKYVSTMNIEFAISIMSTPTK